MGSRGKVTPKLSLKGSAGFACVEIAWKGVPSKGLREMTAGHRKETGGCEEQGVGRCCEEGASSGARL